MCVCVYIACLWCKYMRIVAACSSEDVTVTGLQVKCKTNENTEGTLLANLMAKTGMCVCVCTQQFRNY